MDASPVHEVVIVGSGPAGYTAALYTARADLRPVVVEGYAWGGLLQQTTEVENFPGFPQGIMGPALMQDMRDQAERFGARMITDLAYAVRISDQVGGVHEVETGEEILRARAVILATGSEPRKLGIPGEEQYAGRGVSYCATCDAAFFRGGQIVVVGGGDSAMEEAIFLAKFAAKVTVVHRREDFRASKIMLERARAVDNIEMVTSRAPVEMVGDATKLTALTLAPTDTSGAPSGAAQTIDADGCFVAIGHEPQSALVAGQLDLDDHGHVLVDGRSSRTARPGVLACGDLIDPEYRQAVTAAGSGCTAALDAERYLRDLSL